MSNLVSNIANVINNSSPFSAQQKGHLFEQFCKWFLENDPRYTAQLKNVWLWNAWPDNWGRDKGIDLIAETHDGKIWAIQAKAYDEARYISKEDMDRFLSESSRKVIAYRLLMATTNNIGQNAREVINGQEKSIGLCLLDHLEESLLDWTKVLENPDSSLSQKTILKPRPDQEQALTNIITGFKYSSHGQLHMACGTGKTLIALWLTEHFKSQLTVVLVPSISLVAQLYREWSNAKSENFNFTPIFVCSDLTVSKKDEDHQSLKSTDLGFPVTTNACDIINAISSSSRPKVIFATYHSSPVLVEACRMDSSLTFDLAIADEAHRCAGSANSDFASIVNKDAIRTRYKLFMTATPKIFTDSVKKIAKSFDHEVVSMDDPEKFGPVFHKLPFSDAIREGLLSDYQVIVSVNDNNTYREYAERGRFVAIDNHETDARTVAGQIIIAKAIKQYGLARIISFHNRTKAAQEFSDSFPKALKLLNDDEHPTIHFKSTISGDMPQSDRSKILKQFKESLQHGAAILANVRCLSEGVDVPMLDGIVFIDPKGSEIEIIQAIGRVIRKSPGKKLGTIIIPIFLDGKTDETISLEQSCFKTVWRVIKALRAHDDILAEELDTIRLELGRRTYKNPPKLGKITIDVPINIGVEFGEALILKIIETCSSEWMDFFGQLIQFRKDHPNDWPNSKSFYATEKSLGMWCVTQRKVYAKGKMLPERLQLLNNIDFIWNPLEESWKAMFEKLCNFRKLHPNKWPSTISTSPDEKKLAWWCGTQRISFKRKILPSQKIDVLNSIGFIWNEFDIIWMAKLEQLKEFRKNNPTSWPSQKSRNPDEKKLGSWCTKQRHDFENGTLSHEQVETLNDLEFCWDPIESTWLSNLNCVELFILENNRLPSCKSQDSIERRLGMWCGTQRQALKNHRKNRLTHTKIEALKKIGIRSDQSYHNLRWEREFKKLCEFRLNNPSRWPKRSMRCPQEFELAEWYRRQRKSYINGQISQERKNKLNTIGFSEKI